MACSETAAYCEADAACAGDYEDWESHVGSAWIPNGSSSGVLNDVSVATAGEGRPAEFQCREHMAFMSLSGHGRDQPCHGES